MSVVEFPQRRAIDMPVLDELPIRMSRSLATHYWRRMHMLSIPGNRLPAMEIFDGGMIQCLASLKLHLAFAPQLEALMRAEIDVVGQELLQNDVSVFAHACLDVLKLQLDRDAPWPTHFWEVNLQSEPSAVLNALRFCFNDNVAQHVVSGASDAALLEHPALLDLMMRLGISRPAVSDPFAARVAELAQSQVSGASVLSGVRCGQKIDEAKALKAIEEGRDAGAALVALALASNPNEFAAAKAVLAHSPNSHVALAMCAAHNGLEVALALRQGAIPNMSWQQQIYAAALVGDGPLLKSLATHTDWSDELACRALADGMALLVGTTCDFLYDPSRLVSERESWISAALSELPTSGPTIRMGRDRAQVLLEESALMVGAPLRQMLYIEYAARQERALWIEADDLASVQALAMTTASVFELPSLRRSAP